MSNEAQFAALEIMSRHYTISNADVEKIIQACVDTALQEQQGEIDKLKKKVSCEEQKLWELRKSTAKASIEMELQQDKAEDLSDVVDARDAIISSLKDTLRPFAERYEKNHKLVLDRYENSSGSVVDLPPEVYWGRDASSLLERLEKE